MWVILSLFSTTEVFDPGRHPKRTSVRSPRLLQIADKCLIADLEALFLLSQCDIAATTGEGRFHGVFRQSNWLQITVDAFP